MPDLLIVYGTVEGQTRKICEYLATEAESLGFKTSMYEAAGVPPGLDYGRFTKIIVAASVHIERHQQSVVNFVKAHRAELERVPTAFVSVSLSAAGDAEERYDAWAYTRQFSEETHWRPPAVHVVAGALRFTKEDFFKRWAMKRLAKDKRRHTHNDQDYEYTDWVDLDVFLKGFLSPILPPPRP